MINFSCKRIMCVVVVIAASFMDVYSCMTTFFNDGRGTIVILDHNNLYNKNNINRPGTFIFIPKNTSRRFGRADEHAHFTVYTKQPKSQMLSATYEAKQNECGKNGNPFLKLSSLRDNSGEASLFTVTRINGPHGSMVGDLPSMKRADIYKEEKEEPSTHCSACSGGN